MFLPHGRSLLGMAVDEDGRSTNLTLLVFTGLRIGYAEDSNTCIMHTIVSKMITLACRNALKGRNRVCQACMKWSRLIGPQFSNTSSK